jgi:hypothetical protein
MSGTQSEEQEEDFACTRTSHCLTCHLLPRSTYLFQHDWHPPTSEGHPPIAEWGCCEEKNGCQSNDEPITQILRETLDVALTVNNPQDPNKSRRFACYTKLAAAGYGELIHQVLHTHTYTVSVHICKWRGWVKGGLYWLDECVHIYIGVFNACVYVCDRTNAERSPCASWTEYGVLSLLLTRLPTGATCPSVRKGNLCSISLLSALPPTNYCYP